MTASRFQHLIASGLVLAVAVIVGWLSFTQQPAEAFLFPRLISVVFVLLALWNFARAALGLSKVGEGVDMRLALTILPGLVVALIYIFFAAKTLGFYLASTIAFLVVYTLYDPVPVSDLRGWVRRIVITAVFMAVIYGLFAMLLQVQTPRGLFI
ncbi:MAG: tripartite tricarboxylate transporter TctB family protein [Pseudomonadota bacterium]